MSLKGAIPIAPEDGNESASRSAGTNGGNIEFPVTIKITYCDRRRGGSGGEVAVRSKRAVGLAEKHRDRVVTLAGNDQVPPAVAVEVSEDDSSRAVAARKVRTIEDVGRARRRRKRCQAQ